MFIAQSGSFAVAGQRTGTPKVGEYQLRNQKGASWRVVNVKTRKLASAEFYNVGDAVIHMESLAQLHRYGK